MGNIHWGSVIRSGTTAAVVAGFLLLVSFIPVFDGILGILLTLGILLIPIGAGMGYGYWSTGKETLKESALGGAFSGVIAGIILGIAFGLSGFGVGLSTGIPGAAVTSGLLVTAGSAVVLGAAGLILGALGGVIWTRAQKYEDA